MSLQDSIAETYKNYLAYFPDEEANLVLLQKQISEGDEVVSRKNFKGHATASGLVVSPERAVLMVFHNIFERYQQPGGHIDDTDRTVVDAAMREVVEETGLSDVTLHPWCAEHGTPVSIDTHPIAANEKKAEDAHFHHDFLYIFETQTTDIVLQEKEVSDFRWVPIADFDIRNAHLEKAIERILHNGIV